MEQLPAASDFPHETPGKTLNCIPGKRIRPFAGGSTLNTAHIIKAWRAELGLSQSRAAALLGVNLRTYQGWENGRPFPYPEILRLALAKETLAA